MKHNHVMVIWRDYITTLKFRAGESNAKFSITLGPMVKILNIDKIWVLYLSQLDGDLCFGLPETQILFLLRLRDMVIWRDYITTLKFRADESNAKFSITLGPMVKILNIDKIWVLYLSQLDGDLCFGLPETQILFLLRLRDMVIWRDYITTLKFRADESNAKFSITLGPMVKILNFIKYGSSRADIV